MTIHIDISEGRDMSNKKELDRVLQEISARWGIPGLGVGIVEDGEIVYARGFGATRPGS